MQALRKLNPMLALTIAATVQISVLGSFSPVEFELQPVKGIVLMVETQGRTAVLDHERTITLTGPARVTGPNGSGVRFRLGVPGKVSREYSGKLEVRRLGYRLQAIVEMDRETAVAAIIDAEGAPGLPFEARKAQAVVTRSYLAGAHNRHEGYDFCDTEHCQLLKEPPPAGSSAAQAAIVTRGQVLTYRGDVVAALYSANCGGHTKSLAQSSWSGASLPQPGYPYYSVVCPLRGRASGHGVGMCQLGAIEIAQHGYSAGIILRHFFPNTNIETLEHLKPKPGGLRLDKITAAPARRVTTASVGTGVRVAP
jgi:peptidoglycan hydrolase-like amidase